MVITRRFMLMGTASMAVIGASMTANTVKASLRLEADAESKALLLRMVRVMYPHAKFSDAPYQRTCDAVRAAAGKSIGATLMFAEGVQDLEAAGFAGMDDAAALSHLKTIEATPFFQMVRGTAVVALYNDHEVWDVLGYEGASYDQGGYIDRGFNDLDWLPEPRITER
ncbi:MAG: hypothetical protein AAF677_00120 [Pseudomonadota bacterium]